MRALKKCAAIVLAAAMVITAAPTGSADAAKKPKLKKKASVEVGKPLRLRLRMPKRVLRLHGRFLRNSKMIA